jgi:sugar O-acyltransferase (sialic acid O-acetyltransferase NeuD family)
MKKFARLSERKRLAVYGAGGFGREVLWLIRSCANYEPVCFIDDDTDMHGISLNGIPVMSLEQAFERFSDARVVLGIAAPKTREFLVNKAASMGFNFETVIHPRVEYSQWVEIGKGTVICAGNILTTNIRLGEQVHINLDCTIGHNVIMGNYTTLAPGVHISGWVHFGKRVFVGTGAVIINGTEQKPITIGDDAVIGAGAVVLQKVPSGETVVGVPAKPAHNKAR